MKQNSRTIQQLSRTAECQY